MLFVNFYAAKDIYKSVKYVLNMKVEDRLRSIINESVKDALNESLKCSLSDLRSMYLTMTDWQKIDCHYEAYDEFKEALDKAIDKLGEVIMTQQIGHRFYGVDTLLGK